ncbi:hypothetical protein ACHMW5_13605 [Azospirillum melinis]|uniref:hypothetical protein n=1 Tax=Azospirillum melinis TaxID=328839 RepID=UPI0037565118
MAVDEFAGNGAEMQVHTPGPWDIELNGPNNDEIMIVSTTAKDLDGDRIPVADLFRGGYDYSDFGFSLEANARLIAAAPDLAAAARAYEAWEADLILNGDWSNELPRMTQAQYDRLLEIQAMRNAALRKAGGNANG